ncbi:MAG: MFS transporter, partial [Rhodoluna sp.]|nr:MFS transporter [Rhodoluna sp.]MBP6187024.1 MFS transporter [Rhodoluna sp.]
MTKTKTSSHLRNKNFLALWGGQTVSEIGSQLSGLALPVFAVTMLNVNESQMGFLNASSTASFLLVGLIAGAWVDRWIKRRVMIWADIIRLVAVLSLPILYFANLIEVWHLFVAAGVIGLATVFFDVAYQSFVPLVVPKEQIASANSSLETTNQLSGIAGPAIVGGLLTVFKAPALLIADAISFLVSAMSLSAIRDREVPKPKEQRNKLRHEIAEGLKFVWGNKIIRAVSFTTSTSNLFSTAQFTLIPLVLLRDQNISPAVYGVIASISAVGGLLGAVTAARLSKWIGEGQVIAVSAVIMGAAAFAPAIAASSNQLTAIVVYAAGQFVISFTVLTYNITQVSARQRLCPEHLLGRMNASIRFFVWGVMPIGALLAGATATAFGIAPVMWVCAIGVFLSAGFVVFSPLSRMKKLPDAPEA